MANAALFHLSLMVITTHAVRMCTTLDRLKGVKQGVMLPNSQITNLTTLGMMTCSTACLVRRICKSFNFNFETGECQLNRKPDGPVSSQLKGGSEFVFSDISHWPARLGGVCADHTCPLNSYCDPADTTSHVCRVTYCLGTPLFENGHAITKPAARLHGTRLTLICDPGYMAEGDVVCKKDGRWSSPVCVSVSSCSLVKQYQSDIEDGEYWLRLNNFGNYTTKIYCHNMATPKPREYLTLQYPNYGYYPRVSNKDCRRESIMRKKCKGNGGEIWFNRVRLNIRTSEVSVEDRTFTNFSHRGNMLRYGGAHDCYTPHRGKTLRCGTRGKFIIDLRGTGWRIRNGQEWETYGWQAMIEKVDNQLNGTLVELKCGGFGGGCQPKDGLFLKPWART